MTSIARLAGAVVALALVAAACAGTAEDEGELLLVVTTTSILGDVTTNITGGFATVEVLMGPGQDPHDYRPSAAQAARLRDADLVVANGLGLEEGLSDVLAAAVTDGVAVLEVGPAVSPLPFRGDPDSQDPHVWLDPERMAEVATLIGRVLADIDPASGDSWTDRAAAYRRRVLETHAEIVELLAPLEAQRRVLVTNHDALGYFANRYGFEIVGTIIPSGSTLAEPSAADLASLVDVVRERRLPAIFAETTQRARLAEVIAAELGDDVAVVELYTGALGPAGSGAATYLELLTTNAQRIAEALAP